MEMENGNGNGQCLVTPCSMSGLLSALEVAVDWPTRCQGKGQRTHTHDPHPRPTIHDAPWDTRDAMAVDGFMMCRDALPSTMAIFFIHPSPSARPDGAFDWSEIFSALSSMCKMGCAAWPSCHAVPDQLQRARVIRDTDQTRPTRSDSPRLDSTPRQAARLPAQSMGVPSPPGGIGERLSTWREIGS